MKNPARGRVDRCRADALEVSQRLVGFCLDHDQQLDGAEAIRAGIAVVVGQHVLDDAAYRAGQRQGVQQRQLYRAASVPSFMSSAMIASDFQIDQRVARGFGIAQASQHAFSMRDQPPQPVLEVG